MFCDPSTPPTCVLSVDFGLHTTLLLPSAPSSHDRSLPDYWSRVVYIITGSWLRVLYMNYGPLFFKGIFQLLPARYETSLINKITKYNKTLADFRLILASSWFLFFPTPVVTILMLVTNIITKSYIWTVILELFTFCVFLGFWFHLAYFYAYLTLLLPSFLSKKKFN